MPATAVAETGPVAPTTPGTGRFTIQLIDAGWGSSGYYSPAVLEQAATDRVFPAGTQMFTDHPTPTEDYERPARSVKDLAAVLVEDARYDSTTRALVAQARVYAPWRAALESMAPDIGVSIRGIAEGEPGEVEGRAGFVVTRLLEGLSVDFVTKAGRGGRVLQVLEHARPVGEARNVGQWVESRIHRDFTVLADEMFGDGRLTRDERIALSSAIGDALGAFVTSLEQAAPHLYARDIWDEPTAAPAVTESVPVTPAGQSTTHTLESKEDTMPKIEIDEARLAALEADAGRVSTLEHERDTALAKAAALEAVARNRPIVAAVLAESTTIPAPVQGPVVEAVLTALPADADEATVKTAAEAARTAKETEVATILEAAGHGTVRGLGAPTHAPVAEAAETELDTILARTFGRTPKEA